MKGVLTVEEYIIFKNNGYTDDEIARIKGKYKSWIYRWKMENKVSYSKLNVDRYLSLVEEGLSDYQIAEEIGVERDTIVKFKKRVGLFGKVNTKKGSKGKKLFTMDVEDYKNMIDNGYTINEIAHVKGVNPSTIYEWKKRENVKYYRINSDRYLVLSRSLTDNEIAEFWDINVKSLSAWKVRNGLKGYKGAENNG